MKLYKISAKRTDEKSLAESCQRWVGTLGDAARARKFFNSDLKFKRDNIKTEEVEVPTNKAGLLAFLNGEGGL